ncbi:MAG: LamG-like jellyroll fold domain-containing protein [Candidatus Falkowbacteria bacterium]
MKTVNIKSKNKPAMSLVELIIAMAIFALIVMGLTGMAVGGYTALDRSGEQTEAASLAQEGIEAVRAIKSQAWNNLSYSTSGVQIVGGQWAFTGEGTTDTIGRYTRTISFANVCLNSDNITIAACPADHVDPLSKMVTVDVAWSAGTKTSHVIRQQYLTNYLGHFFKQTDWAGSSGQSIWSVANKYFSDNASINTSTAGQISLIAASGATSTASNDWTYTNASDYTYNSGSISVAGGLAQLKIVTTTPDASTMGLWHMNDASGNFVDSGQYAYNLNIGGTPTTYATSGKFDTSIYFNNNGQARGIVDGSSTNLRLTGAKWTVEAWVYKTAAATTTETILSKWNETGNMRAYILYIDSTNHPCLWLSNNGVNNTLTLCSPNTLTLSQWVHIAAVYDQGSSNITYLFVGGALLAQSNYSNGNYSATAANFYIGGAQNFSGASSTFRGKIDEVRLSNVARWTAGFTPTTTPYASSYPTTSPSIYQTSTYATTSVLNWSHFTETATTNGGSISYQLSPDNSNWWWWNGSKWATTTSSYNTSSVIDTNIPTFTTSTNQINVKAFLTSNGAQLVQLDNINIAYVKQGAAGCSQVQNPYSYDFTFANSTDYTYNATTIEFVAGQAQLKLVSAGAGNTMGLWHMDDASGNFVDSSGSGYNLSTAYGAGTPTYATSGKFSTSIFFNKDYGRGILNASAPNLQITGPMTIEAWVYKPSALTGYNFEEIAGKWNDTYNATDGSAAACYNLAMDYSEKVRFDVSSNGNNNTTYVMSSGALPLDQWVHLAGVYDGTNLYIFVNGTLSGTYAYTAGIANKTQSNFTIGYTPSFNSAAWYFGGRVDEVRVSNVARWTSTFVPSASAYSPEGGSAYSTTSPSVNATVGFSTSSAIASWTHFTETATVNGGSISYQLSSDGGTTWTYWNGSSWATAGAGNYNSAAVIDTNIPTFTTSTKQINARAFLTSNGAQLVQLDNINISYLVNGGMFCGGTGSLISSAINMSTSSAVSDIAWDEDLSSCTPNCSVKMQLRTAPDSSGAPGTWTGWYGASGVGTYFTNHWGTITNAALNGNQWLQYQAFLYSSSTGNPILQEVRVDFQ